MTLPINYNGIVAAVLEYLERNDASTTAEIPVFIMLAENRIARELKILQNVAYVTGTLQANVATMLKPIRWHNFITFNYGSGTGFNTRNQVYLRTYEFCRNYAPDPTVVAPPVYYCDYDYTTLLLAPTPDQNYPFEMAYMQIEEPLSASNQTSTLTQFCPDLLFYAVMVESMNYLKNDEGLARWRAEYDRAMASISSEDKQRFQDRASDRGRD